jgi:two-component system NarL family response regulator
MSVASTQLGESTGGRVITVATVEDQPVIREGVAAIIDATEGFRCVGRYASVEEAVAGLARRTPDVVLTDLGLPRGDRASRASAS